MPQTSHSHILDHLGLVAGMFEELGITEVIDKATQQDPAMRMVTAGHAVKAMVLNGLGFVNQQLSLVPHFLQNTPTSRRIAPAIAASPLNDDTLGRALDTLYDSGVTELYRRIVATAAKRLGLAPTFTPLESPSVHVDGRSNSDEEPAAQVMHVTRGSSRAHRPDLNQGRLALRVEHQAGMPVLMTPRSGNSRDTKECGHVIRAHIAQLQTTYGTTYLVADSALSSAANLQQLAETQIKGIPRVPATSSDAQAALAQADLRTMAPLPEGSRSQVLPSTYGGGAQRWMLIDSEHRHPQARRTGDQQLRKHSDKEVHACKKLCRTAFACAVDAQQALAAFGPRVQATFLHEVALRPTPRYGKRGRPGQGVHPAQIVSGIEGALASSIAARQALVDQQSCFILATNALDDTR